MNELLTELNRLKQYGSQFNHVILIRLFYDYIIETDNRIKELEKITNIPKYNNLINDFMNDGIIWGLNFQQIIKLKNHYESTTGLNANEL